MGEELRELTVVGEHEQTGRVVVEPPDREHPRLGRDEVDDGAAPLGVGGGRHHPVGFVHQVVDEVGRGGDRDAVHADVRDGRVDPVAEPGRLPVDRHSPVAHEVLGDAS